MKTNELYRPKYHYTSEKGWINDPNGFSIYGDKYHLFAQHNPHDSKWGPMHWSHAVSDDLIKWEHKPIALTPTEIYEDELGCFSGTAIEENGKHIIMYTGCSGKIGETLTQTQCIAIGDGTTYEKIAQNPVLDGKDLPSFAKTTDFRDPKLFKIGEFYYALMGAMVTEKKIGTMLLYKSGDLINWEYVGEILRACENGLMGIVFECPDIFKLGDKYIILASPIDMPSQGDKYTNVSSAVYFVGDMDFNTGKFTADYYDEIDTGFDFYAPQSLEDKNGERIMIAWAQMWERNFVTDELNHGWAGAMSVPRILTLENKMLHQKPVKSLEKYHGKKYNNISKGDVDTFRLKINADISEGKQFEIELLKTLSGSFKISYDRITNQLIINRSQSLFRLDRHPKEKNVGNVRKIKLDSYIALNLDIIVDKSLIEIFINDGRFAMTSNYYKGKGKTENMLNTDYKVTVEKIDLI